MRVGAPRTVYHACYQVEDETEKKEGNRDVKPKPHVLHSQARSLGFITSNVMNARYFSHLQLEVLLTSVKQ